MTVGTRRATERIAVAVVPLLLVVVAVLQIGRAMVLDQSSFAGFGFGMFATYENELSRWTEVTATADDGSSVGVRPDAGLDLAAQEVPTARNIDKLASSVLASDDSLRAVHVAVWTVSLTDRPMRLDRVLLIETTAERDS